MSITPQPNEFLVFPIVDLDLMVFFRGGDISRPLYVPYSKFIAFLSASISPASALLLQTNGTNNGSQTLLNLIQGSGITITDNGSGGITISASGGGSITADNGLTASGSNVQLGGSLIQDTTITNSIYDLIITGTPTVKGVDYSLQVISTAGNGGALLVNAFKQGIELISGSVGMSVVSGSASLTTKGTQANQYTLVDGSATSLISSFKKEFLSVAASNGDGMIIAFLLANPLTNPNSVAGQISSLYTDASLGRVKVALAAADQQGGGNIIFLEGHYDGSVVLPQYGSGAFTGIAAWNLAVDASGNIIEVAAGGGSLLNDTTGILFGGALSATIGGTTFSVTAGIGQIVTQTASISGVATTVSNVTWSAVTGASITNIGTSQFTYVLVDSSGVVIQQTTPFTDAQYKTHIIIGILCHIDLASVNLVTNAQNVAYEDPHRLVELIEAFGPVKKSGLNIGANGANLRVNRTSGEAFKIGANYITDQFEPDVATIAAQTPALLCRVHRDGSGGFIFDVNGGSYYNDIDPSNYDDGTGTLQSVGGSKWTIQRLFFFPNNPADIICYYGTQVYNQFSEARANLEFETFDEATITAENAVFLGYLFVRNAATDLSLSTQAAFLQSGLFRGIPPGGGGSGGGGGAVLSQNSVTGDGTIGNEIELVNDTASPGTLRVYGTDAAGTKGWQTRQTFVPDIAIYPYQAATYLGDSNPLDIHVSATVDRLYLPANSSGTIKFYEASTNVSLGSVSLTNVGSCFYIESTGELWATNLSNGTINRYDASTPGASLGTITGSGTRGLDHIEYSATKVFISNYTSNSVTVVNPTTNTVDATISSASLGGTGIAGMVYVDNPLSDHDGLIAVILRSTNEVALIDPATNTVVAAGVNPSSKLNSPVYIAYDIATDQYFITNASGNNISVLTPASATTFSHVKDIEGIINPFGIVSDATTGLVYVCFGSNNTSTSNGVVSVAVIDPATNSIVKIIPTLGYNSTIITVYNITLDSTNGYIYVNGYGGSVGRNITTKLKIR